MDEKRENTAWDAMSHDEKKHQLYLNQKELLDRFLECGTITRAQYDRSLHDLTVKMGETA